MAAAGMTKKDTRRVLFERQANPANGSSLGVGGGRLALLSRSGSGDATNNGLDGKQSVDLVEWEKKAKDLIRTFCFQNNLDFAEFCSIDDPKNPRREQKVNMAQNQSSINKLTRIIKALEKLMTTKQLPAVDVISLLQPLADLFLVRKSATYWHVYVKAAVAQQNYDLAMMLLDRATKYEAEPIMERLRTASYIAREAVAALGTSKGQKMEGGDATTCNRDNREGPPSGGAGEAAGVNDHDQNHDNAESEVVIENPMNGSTQPSVEATYSEGADCAPKHVQEVEDPLQTIETPTHERIDDKENIDDRTRTLLPIIVETSPNQEWNSVSSESIVEESPEVFEDTDAVKTVRSRGSSMRIVSTDVEEATGNDANGNKSAKMASAAASASPRGRSDQSLLVKSSTTKLLVVKNTSAKKQNANGGNAPEYYLTPVRRSTRKAAQKGYDQWNTYRCPTTIDSPSDWDRMGVSLENSELKRNRYLRPESDSDE